MEKQGDNKFTWMLKYPTDLRPYESRWCESDTFVIGGCKWCLSVRYQMDKLSMYLACATSLPHRWERRAKFRITMVNHISEELSIVEDGTFWFWQNYSLWGGRTDHLLCYIGSENGGFIRDGEVKIVAEVDVFEVIGELDVPNEPEETNKTHENDEEVKFDVVEVIGEVDVPNESKETDKTYENDGPVVEESIDVNGFQVLLSQVKSVRRIFEKHPDVASEFRAKNQLMRKTCMNFLLNLIETMCQPLEELLDEDIVEADIALTYLKDAGFKVDWLEKKLDVIKERKEKEQSGLSRLQEIEENLMELKKKCSDLDELAEKEKEELSSTRTPMSFDDLV